MNDEWYIARDGQTFGPYPAEQLPHLAATNVSCRPTTFFALAPVIGCRRLAWTCSPRFRSPR